MSRSLKENIHHNYTKEESSESDAESANSIQNHAPLLSLGKAQSQMLLETNTVFEKLLQKEIYPQPTLEDILAILSKKNDQRTKEEVKKLTYYFKGLSFFESLKKESDVDTEDLVYQCCRELKYRKYAAGEKIIKYGEDGNEFFIIIDGTVGIYTPKLTEFKMTLNELYQYLEKNMDNIVWDRSSRYIYDQFLEHQKIRLSSPPQAQGALKIAMKRSFQSMLGMQQEHHHYFTHHQIYEFSVLTHSMSLSKGLGFGELALMSMNKQKPEKRSATVLSVGEVHCAILEKDDFSKVFLSSLQKKLDTKVEFFKNFRISEGISRTNLNKLSYFLKEKQFRRRDVVYKEGDLADYVYFIKEGEFEITKRINTKLDKPISHKPLSPSPLKKTLELHVSIIGANQILGLEDLNKDKQTYRQHKAQCITEKAVVYYLTRDEYFSRFYKQLSRHVVNENQRLKEPFFSQRLYTLQNMAQKEGIKYLEQKERYLKRDIAENQTLIQECKTVVDQVQNEELCSLLMKHKLLKRPQIKIERVSSIEGQIEGEPNSLIMNDYDPQRYSNKEYFLKLSKLYNQYVFNTNPASPSSQTRQMKSQRYFNDNQSSINKIEQYEAQFYQTESFVNKSPAISPKSSSTQLMKSQGTNILGSNRGDLQHMKKSAQTIKQNHLQDFQQINQNKQSYHSTNTAAYNSTGGFKISLVKNQSQQLQHNLNRNHLLQGSRNQPQIDGTISQSNKGTVETQDIGDLKYLMKPSLSSQPLAESSAFQIQLAKQQNQQDKFVEQIKSDRDHPNNSISTILGDANISIDHDIKQQKASSIVQSNFNGKKSTIVTSQQSPFKDQFLNRRQKSQSLSKIPQTQPQLHFNNHYLKNRGSKLTLEDIQAHLQKSQNSLIKMLEARIRQKQQEYQQAQQQQQNQDKLPMLSTPMSPESTAQTSSGFDSDLRQLMNSQKQQKVAMKKSNIYFNMYITRKPSQQILL